MSVARCQQSCCSLRVYNCVVVVMFSCGDHFAYMSRLATLIYRVRIMMMMMIMTRINMTVLGLVRVAGSQKNAKMKNDLFVNTSHVSNCIVGNVWCTLCCTALYVVVQFTIWYKIT